jgi:hypothetical protein
MKGRNKQRTVIILVTLILIFSAMPISSADSGFSWRIKDEDRFDYHVRIHVKLSQPDSSIVVHTSEYDAYVIVGDPPAGNPPAIPEQVNNLAQVLYSPSSLCYFTNGSQDAHVHFQAVAIGNWTKLKRLHELWFTTLPMRNEHIIH